MDGAKQPSLQRLLALDKTFDSIEDRMNEICRILNLSLTDLEAQGESFAPSSYGRHDWAFRWIVRHLKDDQQARASGLVWRLLRGLFITAPATVTAKWLASSSLFNLLSQALEEVTSTTRPQRDQLAQTNGTAELKLKGSDQGSVPHPSSKKRKRGQDSVPAAPSSTHPQANVLQEINDLLAFLLSEQSGTQNTDTRSLQAKLLSNVTAYEAARFVKLWAAASTECAIVPAEGQPRIPLARVNSGFRHLGKALQRKRCAFDAVVWREAFSKESLWPLLVLGSAPTTTDARDIRDFIVEELLLPTRDAATETSNPGRTPSGPDPKLVDDCLEGVLNGAVTLLGSKDGDGPGASAIVGGAFSLLLDASIELVDATGLGQKRNQVRWLESIITGLSSIRSRLNSLVARTAIDVCRPVMRDLLSSYAKRSDLSRSPAVRALLNDYSHTGTDQDGDEDTSLDLTFVAAALAADPHVFELSTSSESTTLSSVLHAVDGQFAKLSVDDRQTCVDGVVVPIIESQAHAQTAHQMLDTVVKIVQGRRSTSESLWLQSAVKHALSRLVSSSVDTAYLRDVLTRLTTSVKSIMDQEADESALGQHLSSIVLIIQIIVADDTLDVLEPELTSVLSLLNTIATGSWAKKHIEKDLSFWKLTRLLNQCLSPSPGQNLPTLLQMQEEVVAVGSSLTKKLSKGKLEDDFATALLDYLHQHQVLEACHASNENQPTVLDAAFLANKLMEKNVLPSARSFIGHPWVWDHTDHDTQHLVLNELAQMHGPEPHQLFLQLWDLLREDQSERDWEKLIDILFVDSQNTNGLALDILTEHVPIALTSDAFHQKVRVFLSGRASSMRLKAKKAADTKQNLEALQLSALLEKYGADVTDVQKLRGDALANIETIGSKESTGNEGLTLTMRGQELTAMQTLQGDPTELLSLLAKKANPFETDAHPVVYNKLIQRCTESMKSWSGSDKVNFCHALLDLLEADTQIGALSVLEIAVTGILKSDLSDDVLLGTGLRIVHRMTQLLSGATDLRMCHCLLRTVSVCLKDKRFLLNQYNIENTIQALHRLTTSASSIRGPVTSTSLYLDICSTTQLILQFYRPSLGGRLHLLLPLLTQLLSCLFTPVAGRGSRAVFHHPQWLQPTKPLKAKHASRFARLITLLCNPPQSTVSRHRSRSRKPGLVDELREARLHVSEFVGILAHAFCRFTLNGTLGDGVKQALNPALYAVFDVLDMAAPDDERVKALGASMTKAELALLRTEHGEWKRFGRWQG